MMFAKPEEALAFAEPLVFYKACKLLEGRPSGEIEMKTDNFVSSARRWTATELRKVSQEQRDAIMEAAAALAEGEYRSNAELTAFEAFGKDDCRAQ